VLVKPHQNVVKRLYNPDYGLEQQLERYSVHLFLNLAALSTSLCLCLCS
jgi:hypothetical protein